MRTSFVPGRLANSISAPAAVIPLAAVVALLLAAPSLQAEQPPVTIVEPRDLPVAMDTDFEFRKSTILNNDGRTEPQDTHPMVRFEKERVNFGAITPEDFRQRKGHYYTFYWKNRRPADVTVRFEYRQSNLGPYVQAREVAYPAARKGNHKTGFEIVGDDFFQDGRVIAWRAVLIVDDRIAATTQSYLWD